MWVRMARFGLSFSIQPSVSATLKWLGCGSRRSASTIQTSRPWSSAMARSSSALTSQEYARLPKRKPSEAPSPCCWAYGAISIGPLDPSIVETLVRRDPVHPQDRRICAAGRRPEAVCEGIEDAGRCRVVGMDFDEPLVLHPERAEIVDAVEMVGMGMGVEHAVDMIDAGRRAAACACRGWCRRERVSAVYLPPAARP